MLVRLLLILGAPSLATAQVIDHVSRGAQGQPGDGDFLPQLALSGDGRVAAFVSTSSNLAPGASGRYDVFLRDERGALSVVSRGLGGAPANGGSDQVALSRDGRIVAFRSSATNLVAGDTNGQNDLFAYDRALGTLERLNVTSQGAQSAGFPSDPGIPHLSASGRYVVFGSFADDLVPGDTNAVPDVFLRDRWLGLTTRLSTAADGSQLSFGSTGSRITPDGSLLVFTTSAPLTPDDQNGTSEVYLRDLTQNAFERISVSTQGVEGNSYSLDGFPSADGRFVVFQSNASNLVAGDTNGQLDVFVRDRLRGTTRRVSVSSLDVQANGPSSGARISDDGRFVYFVSWASNLVPGGGSWYQDLHVHDRRLRTTRILGLEPAQAWAEEGFALSGDGSALLFLARSVQESVGQIYLRRQPAPGPAPLH